MPLQIRRGTNAERLILASPLVSGELLWIVDDQRLYIGDGTTLARDLAPVTGYNDDDAKDAAASIFTSGTHSGISFTYNGSTAINANVSYPALLQNLSMNGFDITGSGNITINGAVTATSFTGDYKGSISADDSTILVDALNGSINLSGTVKGDVLPDQNEAYDIGSSSNRFKDLYLSGTSLYLGSAQITASGAAVNLPAGSTINGVLISDIESGVVAGSDYNINIVGDDSSSIINSSTRAVTASGGFFGNLTGNVIGNITGVVAGTAGSTLIGNVTGNTTGTHFGDVTGNVTGNTTGNVTGNVTGDVTGNVFGSVIGELKGSVFGDDSSLLIDGFDGRAYLTSVETPVITSSSGELVIDSIQRTSIRSSNKSGLRASAVIEDGSIGNAPQFDLHATRGTRGNPVTPNVGDYLAALRFTYYEGVADIGNSVVSFTAQIDPAANLGDSAPAGNLVLLVNAGDGLGVDGDGVQPFLFKKEGTFDAPIIKTGVYANDAARDAYITSPEAGMIVFNQRDDSTGVPQFQGYDGTNWVDLH